MYWETAGAFTGEISPTMLVELCRYVIIGHSERRTYFSETDATVNRKVQSALAHSLVPIVCVGETLAEYENGRTEEVVYRQVKLGLAELEPGDGSGLVMAYEPVWAIGTGHAATAEGANAVVAQVIRPAVKEMFGEPVAQAMRVLYGGSVKADNAAEFFGMADIDGALVGGASLKASEFLQIVKAAAS
jgi:triosephosphate isomerase